MKKYWILCSCLIAALALAACGSAKSSGSGGSSASNASATSGGGRVVATKSHSINVGLSKPIVIKAGQKANVAMFGATGNTWQNAFGSSLAKASAAAGLHVTSFNSAFNPQTEANQITSAISSGKYNVFFVEAWDSQIVCNPIKHAAAAGILVLGISDALCGRDFNPWSSFWQPGTLTQVGSESTISYMEGWMRAIAAKLPAGSTVQMLTGPQGQSFARVAVKAEQAVLGKKPGITLEPPIWGDYTAPTALSDMQTALTSHPKINAVISDYTDMTRGAASAIGEAGKTGQVKLFDSGGENYSVRLVKSGKEVLTVPSDPVEVAEFAVKAVVDAYDGTPVPRLDDTFPSTVGGSATNPYVITQANVNAFTNRNAKYLY